MEIKSEKKKRKEAYAAYLAANKLYKNIKVEHPDWSHLQIKDEIHKRRSHVD